VKTQLGCDPNKITVEEIEFGVLMKSIKPDVPTPQRPNMFTLGWGPDYPDAQNWIHDVLSCNVENAFKRPCDPAIDGKIDAAAKEADPQKREQMYRELEDIFFGPEGQFPIAPLFLNVTVYLVKPWYTGFFETDGLFGGAHWNTRRIDQAAQLAARGKK
jgi:ABC-type oligopeptide transport system substrate-binding subunit